MRHLPHARAPVHGRDRSYNFHRHPNDDHGRPQVALVLRASFTCHQNILGPFSPRSFGLPMIMIHNVHAIQCTITWIQCTVEIDFGMHPTAATRAAGRWKSVKISRRTLLIADDRDSMEPFSRHNTPLHSTLG